MNLSKSPKKRKKTRLSTTKKQAEDYGLIATAYHESSHTIVGLAHFFFVSDVSVSGADGGDMNYDDYYSNTEDKQLQNLMIISELRTIYAGLVGERMYYRDICGSVNFPMHLKAGSSFDNSRGSELIRQNSMATPGEATSRLKKKIRAEVEKFLTQHWKSVKLVAHAIYRKRHLTFSELKYILTRSEDKEFWKDRFRKIKMINVEPLGIPHHTVKNIISE